MGAGAVKGETPRAQPATSSSRTCNVNQDPKDINMSCEQCSVNFTIFKRKKICWVCRRHHCSNCLPKEPNKPSGQRRCDKCRQLAANPSRAELMNFRVKDLKLYLIGKSVAMTHCTEKNDLVELVLKHNNSLEYLQQQAESRQRTNQMMSNLRDVTSDPSSSSSSGTPPARHHSNVTSQHNNVTSPHNNVTPPHNNVTSPHNNVTSPHNDVTSPHNDNASQPNSDITSSDRPTTAQPNTTSANQNNFAEFSETRAQQLRERQQREMREAQQRMRTEWSDEQTDPRPGPRFTTLKDVEGEECIEDLSIKQLKEILAANFVDYKGCCEKYELVDRVKRLWGETHKNNQKGTVRPEGSSGEQELCKICMDAVIDCVLLECGHMVTCTTCGRRLNECPICRNYVVRVVHTFKA